MAPIFNLFRISADVLHLSSRLLLISSIERQHSVAGVSLKTQLLQLITFVLRYLDLLYSPFHFWNTPLKLFYIASTAYTVYLVLAKYNRTYTADDDRFRVPLILIPCVVLGFFTRAFAGFGETLWTISLWIEAVSVLPQLFLLTAQGRVELFSLRYLTALGGYRLMYFFNWVWRYLRHGYKTPWVVVVTGLAQTGMYADFLWVCYTHKSDSAVVLPK
jgi:ER lumen protein retaining receptor